MTPLLGRVGWWVTWENVGEHAAGAPGYWGSRGRGFKSRRPDIFLLIRGRSPRWGPAPDASPRILGRVWEQGRLLVSSPMDTYLHRCGMHGPRLMSPRLEALWCRVVKTTGAVRPCLVPARVVRVVETTDAEIH